MASSPRTAAAVMAWRLRAAASVACAAPDGKFPPYTGHIQYMIWSRRDFVEFVLPLLPCGFNFSRLVTELSPVKNMQLVLNSASYTGKLHP